jgi:hypothetical protein
LSIGIDTFISGAPIVVDMRRTAPPSNSHAHEHEWIVIEDDSAYMYEDGALFIRQECMYSEERSAGHSSRLDETFYETMYECGTERTFRFDLVTIEHQYCEAYEDDDIDGRMTLAEGREAIHSIYDRHPELVEEIERAARKSLLGTDTQPEAMAFHDWECVDTSDHSIYVNVEGERYRLTYEFTERKRL